MAEWLQGCFSYFSTKCLVRSNVREEGLTFSHSLRRDTAHHGREALAVEVRLLVALYPQPGSRKLTGNEMWI